MPAKERTSEPDEVAGSQDQEEHPDSHTDVVSAVEAFHTASLAGEYCDRDGVDRAKARGRSAGTKRWNDAFGRLEKRVAWLVGEMDYRGARACYGLMFALLERIDTQGGLVLLADERAAGRVGLSWDSALPIWLVCLSETANAPEFATEVLAFSRRRISGMPTQDELLAEAWYVASDAQRLALDAVFEGVA